MTYLYTYIDYLGAYRIWDPKHPEQTVAYLDAEDLAMVLLEDPDGEKYGGETEEDTRAFMRRLRENGLRSENRRNGKCKT